MLLEYANNTRGDHIIAPDWFDKNRYDLFTVVPQHREDLQKSLAREGISETFGLVIGTKQDRRKFMCCVLILTQKLD